MKRSPTHKTRAKYGEWTHIQTHTKAPVEYGANEMSVSDSDSITTSQIDFEQVLNKFDFKFECETA